MELHVYKNGDEARIEAKCKISELRGDLLKLVRDIDEAIVGPRLQQFAQSLKGYSEK